MFCWVVLVAVAVNIANFKFLANNDLSSLSLEYQTLKGLKFLSSIPLEKKQLIGQQSVKDNLKLEYS